jgi:hypothetical protein
VTAGALRALLPSSRVTKEIGAQALIVPASFVPISRAIAGNFSCRLCDLQ